MKKTALFLMILTMFVKVLGFMREIVLSYYYGAAAISDAYLISVTIPGVIFTFIGVGIATSYIPIISGIVQEKGLKSANFFTSDVINVVMILCTIIVGIVIIFTLPIVKLFAAGFEGGTLNIAVNFTRMSVLGIYFSGIVYIFTSYLQFSGKFMIPALIGVPLNIIVIMSIFFSHYGNVKILPIGNIIAVAFQFLFLLPFVLKQGFKYTPTFDLKDENLNKMIKLSLPVIIGVSINQINVLVDRSIASSIVVGGISALTYANRLNLFIQGIFVTSIATAMYPMISKMAAEKNITGLKKSITESIGAINLFVIPTTVGAMIFARPVVELLFGRGAFGTDAILMTSDALFFYSIGMIGFGLREVLSRAFYSLQDTRTPTINAAIAVTMNIALNLILSRFIGIGGLALATSISGIFCTLLLFISLRKKIGAFGMKQLSISFIKVTIASLIMGVIARLTFVTSLSYLGKNTALVSAMLVGFIIYCVIVYFMKIEDVDSIISTLKRKLNKLKPTP